MAEVRRLVGLGRQARTQAKVKVRQPLSRALVTVPAERREAVAGLLDLVAAELNVKQVGFASGADGLVAYRLVPNFRAIGPRFGGQAPAVAAAIREADAGELAPGLQAGERVAVEVPGLGPVELGPEEAGVVEEPVTGWRVARDLVRAVQDLRKDAGLEVSDRIELAVDADGEVAAAVRAHGDYLQAETLAVALYDAPRADGSEASLELDGSPVRLWLRPVDAG